MRVKVVAGMKNQAKLCISQILEIDIIMMKIAAD